MASDASYPGPLSSMFAISAKGQDSALYQYRWYKRPAEDRMQMQSKAR
jgi:hypothetical protein